MNDTIKVVCENDSRTHDVAMGTTLHDIALECRRGGAHPFLAAYVNNRIKELSYKVYTPVTVRLIDITEAEGHRVYQRTAIFMLQKAVGDLFPGRTLYVRHSLGSGLYCEIEGMPELSSADTEAIALRLHEIAAADYPIARTRRPTGEVREIYRAHGFDDKIALLDSRPRLYSDLYTMDDAVGYFYGALTPSTGYVDRVDVRPYYNGLYLMLPDRQNPSSLKDDIHADKMLDVFRGYKSWVDIMGVPTVGRLNGKVLSGDGSELIKIAEAFHEKQLATIADTIADANSARGTRLVLISGPSSSGKTTFAKRLGIQLRILGMNPVLISLDDYFVDRDKTPLDENGDYDYEALEAIDLELFNDHLRR
nr:nucleoside kinase [Alistipes sp.]